MKVRIYKKVIFSICGKISIPIKRIIGNVLRYIEKDPCVIMYVDGGFSSQILRYGKGMWFKERGHKVKFDLCWYQKYGKDDLGIEERPWRLSKCFPELELEVATDKEINKYRRIYGTDIHDMVRRYKGREEKMCSPLYVSRYDFDYLIPDFDVCTKYFHWEGLYDSLSESAKKVAAGIKKGKEAGKKIIGVHVRRGDMVVTGRYWKVLTAKYFEAAINAVRTNDCILYFFSNGFDFVEKELLPLVHNDYVLVNNRHEDYEDIYLYSLCNVQIASQGSWGNMAFAFNANEDRILVYPSTNREETLANSDDLSKVCIYLEDDMYLHD